MGHIEQHSLGLKLVPLITGELFLAKRLKFPGYIYHDGLFEEIFQAGATPSKEKIQSLITKRITEVFLFEEDVKDIKTQITDAMVKTSRSLSIGDPLKNGARQLQLLSMNLTDLYKDPLNDQLLKLQYQTTLNLSKFLMENKKLQGDFFKSADNDQFPFIISQPLLSSLMMISFMQSTHMFHEKDIENMFLASYLKDFGMALVPPELYDKKQLDDTELSIMSSHASNSFDLLSGRIPMTKNHLLMIKNHHYLNEKLKLLLNKKVNRINPDDEFVVGIESTILGAMDIIVAMTHERPYRTESSMYQALEVLKKLMADEYPQEFKAFVMFIKQFLKN
jgi:hypothetical protein